MSSFWDEKIAWVGRTDVARIDGRHYIIGPENARGERGCGGARLWIQFHDGRLIQTTNLWCQGQIPEEYRDRLPDNAVFAKEVR